LACAVTLAGLAAIGVGYVAFTRTGNITEAAKAPAIPAVPSIGRTLPAEATAPGVDPVATLPVSPTVAATTTSPANAATTTAGSAIQPAIVAAVPASPAGSAPTEPPAPRQAAPRVVTAGTVDATLSYTAEKEGDGIAGYVGTIEISDSGAGDATDWRLTLTVPGGNSVLARGPVEVTQSGEEVQFTPAGDDGAVPAGGSLTFTFTVRGDLTDLPGNCTINGHACS
jgi:mannan endo-1,4-beta-mannosidase